MKINELLESDLVEKGGRRGPDGRFLPNQTNVGLKGIAGELSAASKPAAPTTTSVSSTGGTQTITPTGRVHRAAISNPNQPQKVAGTMGDVAAGLSKIGTTTSVGSTASGTQTSTSSLTPTQLQQLRTLTPAQLQQLQTISQQPEMGKLATGGLRVAQAIGKTGGYLKSLGGAFRQGWYAGQGKPVPQSIIDKTLKWISGVAGKPVITPPDDPEILAGLEYLLAKR